jgi:hypothetical protein
MSSIFKRLLPIAVLCVSMSLVWWPVDGAVKCDASRACFPMASPTCTRGNSINLRFFMDAIPGYENSTVESVDFNNRTITYGFCPRVDELQAFNLTSAPTYSAIDPLNNASIAANIPDTYVSVYGFGESMSAAIPSNTSSSRVMIAKNGTSYCTGDAVLLVDFLVLQISMSNGAFTYPGAVAPRENVTDGVSVQPQGVGFQPTCSADSVCQLDATYHCIGEVGYQNCAKCYSDPLELSNKTVQIWVSYYGTDNNGRRMLSGGNNPLNFRQYAGASVYNTLSNSLDKVSNGQSLDPTLPGTLP